jgi:peptidoglycan-associated lipoprotein
MMQRRLATVLIAMTMTGCSADAVVREANDAAEQRQMAERLARQQADAAARQARMLKEQDELKRLLDERKRRETATSGPQINPLAEAGIDGNALRDPAAALQIPDELLAKQSIYYEYDAYTVKEEYEPVLEAHAALLRAHPDLQVNVEGNCDERGSREYNLALGQRRADAVKRALSLLGASPAQVSAVSFGSEKPKAVGHAEEDLAQNRRSDMVYAGATPSK